MSTLEQLVVVRSALAGELLAYLDELAARVSVAPKHMPPLTRAGGEFAVDRLKRQVRKINRDGSRVNSPRNEPPGLRENRHGEDDPYFPLHDRSLGRADGDEAGFTWTSRSFAQFPRTVILGDPGMGKTWLLRASALRVARDEAQRLRTMTVHPDDIVLPILARLSDLAKDDDDLLDSIVGLVGRRRSDAFHGYVRGKLGTDRCLLLLDALDEVEPETPEPGRPIQHVPGKRPRLIQRLRQFADELPEPRVVVTSRTAGYAGAPVADAAELELLPFSQNEAAEFVRLWFGPAKVDAVSLVRELKSSPQLRGLTRIPIMLMLLCRFWDRAKLPGSSAANRSLTAQLPTKRSELYDRCLRELLIGWRIEDKGLTPDVHSVKPGYVDALFEVIEDAAASLFSEGKLQFTQSALRDALRASLKRLDQNHELVRHPHNATSLTTELVETGVLVPVGDDPEAPLIFLHRTFQEFLTARAIARRDDVIPMILTKVYDAEWDEVLRMVGGLLGARTGTLIAELLRENSNDLLLRPFSLASRVAAEASPADLPSTVTDALCRTTIARYLDQPTPLAEARLGAAARVWGSRAVPFVRDALDRQRLDMSQGYWNAHWQNVPIQGVLRNVLTRETVTRRRAAVLLGDLGDSSLRVLAEQLVADNTEDRVVRDHAARSLGTSGTTASAPVLRQLLDGNPDSHARQALTDIIGSEALLYDSGLEMTDDGRVVIRIPSIDAQAPEALPFASLSNTELCYALSTLEDEEFRWMAAYALRWRPITQEILAALITAFLQDASDVVRTSIVTWMKELNRADVVPALLAALNAETKEGVVHEILSVLDQQIANDTSGSIAASLARVEHPSGRLHGLRALVDRPRADSIAIAMSIAETDPDLNVRCNAVSALAKLRAVESVPLMLRLLTHSSSGVREAGLTALSSLGATDVVPVIASMLLRDPDPYVRARAALALGKMRDVNAVEALSKASVTDGDSTVRGEALLSLGMVGPRTSARVARICLRDDGDSGVRECAVVTLHRIGEFDSVPALLRALKDDRDDSVMRKVANALGDLAGPESSALLLRDTCPEPTNPTVLAEAALTLQFSGDLRTLEPIRSAPDSYMDTTTKIEDAVRRIHARHAVALPPTAAPAMMQAWFDALTRELVPIADAAAEHEVM